VPIVALPSTARGASRIVSSLNGPVSTPRSQPTVVVTEHGVADLRAATLEQRVARMIAIADPAHRPELEAEADRVLADA
jgi:acetyl-CoA hydrolase